MNESQTSRSPIFGRIGLIALAAAFVMAVAVSNVLLRGLRVDLTENRLYTLSEGTISLMESIPEPVNVYFFFSDRATADIPYLRTYAGRVQEMLEEFAAHSDGRLNVTVIDPLPFSEEEDRAAGFGLQAVNLGNSPDPVYFGVAGTNSVGDDESIPFLDPGKESFLEYDLAKLVYTLANPSRPVVALMSSLPMLADFDPMTQQTREPWVVAAQLRQQFELQVVEPGVEAIDDDVDVLMVVHPKDLPDTALFAIDQFVLAGGRALFFVDPHAEIDAGGRQNPMTGMAASQSSNLGELLTAWGVAVDPDHVVLDDRYALTVVGMDGRPVRHLGIIGVDAGGLDESDIITSGLSTLNFAYPGSIQPLPDGAAEIAPLVQSSNLAGRIPTDRLAMLPDPGLLRDDLAVSGQRYTLAARLTGTVPSAFPDGLPAPPGSDASDEGPATRLTESAASVNVVLVADVDMLADRLWVQRQDFFGQQLNTAFANNGDFVVNALDNLLGSEALISIRGRAAFTRPFRKVQDLRRTAENRFRETEQHLQDELAETEARLADLQAGRADQGATILTPEQQAEIERFQERRLEIRKELRQVQRGLDRDIERLGTALKVINIGLMPVLISLFSLFLWFWHGRSRRARAARANRTAS